MNTASPGSGLAGVACGPARSARSAAVASRLRAGRPAGHLATPPSAAGHLVTAPRPGARLVACVDVGSTFTKAVLVDVDAGLLVATASHPTTVASDVLHGLDAAVSAACAAVGAGTEVSGVYACSSAGGGLRLAVVGYEKLVSAEAAHRVALSAGARVVHVSAGRLDGVALSALRADRPDVVLLVGGTDGGDAEVLLHNASRLASARWRRPVVLAGNAAARDAAYAILAGRGVPLVATDNVLPRIGTLAPGPARTAIREVFLRHVIGGKRLSRGSRFASLVRGATPDVVLTAVELLAEQVGGDLVVVDVGGATTDVYSVRSPGDGSDTSPDAAGSAEAAGTAWHARTVEGDLGVRWSAPGVVAAAVAERLLGPSPGTDPRLGPPPATEHRLGPPRATEPRLGPAPVAGDPRHGSAEPPAGSDTDRLAAAAARRAADPDLLPADAGETATDLRLAELAATVALRRHARGEVLVAGGPRRGGRDLRRVRLVVGSGGALRHADPAAARKVVAAVVADQPGGWALPQRVDVVVDTDYVLAAAGLLAADHPRAASLLLERHLHRAHTTGSGGAGNARRVDSPGDTPME